MLTLQAYGPRELKVKLAVSLLNKQEQQSKCSSTHTLASDTNLGRNDSGAHTKL